jgi:death-on-curing protein
MPNFLTLSEILHILEDQIRNYGGTYGVRDIILLSSAIYVPLSGFYGDYLHKTIPAMAAAYAFHICQNHPFIDGNKRVALVSSLVFLDINQYTFNCKDLESGEFSGISSDPIEEFYGPLYPQNSGKCRVFLQFE